MRWPNDSSSTVGPISPKLIRLRVAVVSTTDGAGDLELGEAFVSQEVPDVWSQYAQALLISNEMFIVD